MYQWLEPDQKIYRNETFLRRQAMCDECERLRMQLAACGVAALSNTPESAAKNRLAPENKYYSASYQDVCRAVDSEMKLREKLEAAEKQVLSLEEMNTKQERLLDELREYVQAVGLLSTLAPQMKINPHKPLEMAHEIVASVQGATDRAKSEQVRPRGRQAAPGLDTVPQTANARRGAGK